MSFNSHSIKNFSVVHSDRTNHTYLHVFGSYVTGHLPREHHHVIDTTHDDRAEEGVFLGDDLTTPNFWMYSLRPKKVMIVIPSMAPVL
jgi:hypothetical protein